MLGTEINSHAEGSDPLLKARPVSIWNNSHIRINNSSLLWSMYCMLGSWHRFTPLNFFHSPGGVALLVSHVTDGA